MDNLLKKLKSTDILKVIKKHFSVVLWIFIIVMVIAEGFVLKNSVAQFLASDNESLFGGAQIVRVNFDKYKKIESTLIKNGNFLPESSNSRNVFGTPNLSN